VAKQEHSKIIRADMLRLIESLTAGLVLFADLIDDFEMVPSTFEPSAGISEEVMRPTKEVVNILFSHFDL
jgi:hypothetical protein